MIKEFYPSKEHKKWETSYYERKVIGYAPTLSAQDEAHIAIMCTKLNLTKEVYQLRCAAVVEESRACAVQVGDTVFPVKAKDRETYGKMLVVGICRHFDMYGTVDWNDPPFILSVQSLVDKSTTINCTRGWVIATSKENLIGC